MMSFNVPFWKPKINIVYEPIPKIYGRNGLLNKGTWIHVYFIKGDTAYPCSYMIYSDDNVEVRIKGEGGKIIQQKSGMETVFGTVFAIEKTQISNALQGTIFFKRDDLKFLKYQGSRSYPAQGGYEYNDITYLVILARA